MSTKKQIKLSKKTKARAKKKYVPKTVDAFVAWRKADDVQKYTEKERNGYVAEMQSMVDRVKNGFDSARGVHELLVGNLYLWCIEQLGVITGYADCIKRNEEILLQVMETGSQQTFEYVTPESWTPIEIDEESMSFIQDMPFIFGEQLKYISKGEHTKACDEVMRMTKSERYITISREESTV